MYAYKRGDTYSFEFQHAGRRYRRGGFPTKRLASDAGEALRRQLIEQRVERIYGVRDAVAPIEGPTLAEYATDGYATHHLPTLEPSTQKTARSQLGKLVARLGHHRLAELGPVVLDGYAEARRRDGVSAAQIGEEVTRLSRVVNHARARSVIAAHPFRGWKRPKVHRRDFRVVTEVEERALLRVARADFRAWLVVALDTGLRKGELRVLEAGWIDRRARELRIRQPKVKRVKVVPLTDRAYAALVAGGPHPLGRFSLPWVDRRWQETLRRAGLSGIRFHDLRHTFATRLANARASVSVVGELLGHRPPYTTTLRYFHALPEAKRAAILALHPRKSPRTGRRRTR